MKYFFNNKPVNPPETVLVIITDEERNEYNDVQPGISDIDIAWCKEHDYTPDLLRRVVERGQAGTPAAESVKNSL